MKRAKAVWARLRKRLIGARLQASVERNERAADRLDAALREVLGR